MKTSFEYDLVVIGAGSGGVRASRMAAAAGLKVAVVEGAALGGTCVNVGCVPKKLFVYGAHYAEDFEQAKGFGWTTSSPVFSWNTLRDNKTREIERLNGIYSNLLDKAGVSIIHGKGTLTDAHTVNVSGVDYTSERILLAPGSKAYVPDFPGAEHVITSDDAFYLDTLPESIVIVGGGYIALEFASIFNGLGVDTTLSYRRDLFLRGFDLDVREHVHKELVKKGIKCRFNSTIEHVTKDEDQQLRVSWNNGEIQETGKVMYATGRKPNIHTLNLDGVGVATRDNGEIIVNEDFQTNIKSVYALGDVTGGMQLTPVAIAEAMNFVSRIYQGSREIMDYTNIPTAVFTLPNIATVGLTEEEARKRFNDIRIYRSEFRHLKHTLSGSDEKTFMKLLVDNKTDKVIGCHMIGSEAGEIIQGMAIAIKAGATKATFDHTIGIHPSAAEEFVTMRVAD